MIAGLVDWTGHTDLSSCARAMNAAFSELGLEAPRLRQGRRTLFLALPPFSDLFPGPEAPADASAVLLHGVLDETGGLAAGLDSPGPRSEAALLDLGFRRLGAELADRLLGDFAVARWDDDAAQLLAIVDPLGLRPVYFAADAHRIAWASHPAPLRRLPWMNGAPDERMVVSHLVDVWNDAEATFHAGIRRLPAGHLLEAGEGRCRVRRWWTPFGRRAEAVASTQDVLDRFGELFRRAVRCRLERGPTTLLMSGGLDSTAAAGMAADLPGMPPVSIVSAAMTGLGCDEGAAIDVALHGLPFPARRVCPVGVPVTVDALRAEARLHGAPHLNLQKPMFDLVAEAARAFGARAVLTGVGGDDVTTDYRYHLDLLRENGLLGFPRTVAQVARLERWSVLQALNFLLRAACPAAIRKIARAARRRDEPPAWLSPDARRRAAELGPPLVPPRQGFEIEPLEAVWQLLRSPLVQSARQWWVDEYAGYGLGCRSPFQDRRLIEFLFNVPARLLPRSHQTGQYKPLITRGLSRFLPEEFRFRVGKIVMDEYDNNVWASSRGALGGHLFAHGWLSELFVPRKAARTLFEAGERRLTGDKAMRRIAGLELWLREQSCSPREVVP
jgi:asparagine synthase (glutamine-hydrolysing)